MDQYLLDTSTTFRIRTLKTLFHYSIHLIMRAKSTKRWAKIPTMPLKNSLQKIPLSLMLFHLSTPLTLGEHCTLKYTFSCSMLISHTSNDLLCPLCTWITIIPNEWFAMYSATHWILVVKLQDNIYGVRVQCFKTWVHPCKNELRLVTIEVYNINK